MNQRPLIAFDVDGTLETSNGPVKISLLETLAFQGCHIAIVSPSQNFPKKADGSTLFARFVDKSRHENLTDALNQFAQNGPVALRLYVSDNNDFEEAQKATFIYIDREAFVKGFP